MSKAKNKEEIFIGMIKAGIFEIDDDGRIWRLAARNAWHTIKPVMRRRAEYQGCRHNYLVLQASIAGKKVIALALALKAPTCPKRFRAMKKRWS